jgi:hypothetical protein
MSNEITTPQNLSPAALAEMLGNKSEGGGDVNSGPRTSRLTQIQTPIMAMIEVNGKKMNTEALPVGTFALRISEDETVYSDTATMRVFLHREQWTRWYSDTKEMGKSVLATDLRNDLHDTMGGFNLGRPSGYVEDFNALPEATKDLMRSVKRTFVSMGLVTLDNPMNSSGEALSTEYKDIPFICDLKNNQSIKSVKAALGSLERKNMKPFMGNVRLSSETDTLPNGNPFAYVSATALSGLVDLTEADYDAGAAFSDLLSLLNSKIMDKHYENRDKSMSNEDAELVGSIVDVEG